MLIYIILILALIFLSLILKKYKNGEKIFLIISFIILSLISGLRNFSVGVDTNIYVDFFRHIDNISFEKLNYLRYEYGFSFFCKIVSIITSNYHLFLLIVSLIINYSVINFIKNNSKNKYLSVIMYILCNFYFSHMNIMRQAIAVAIVLFSLEYLKKDKLITFLLLIALASQFHFSAIICLILIPLNKFEFSKKHLPIISIIAVLFFIFGESIFEYLCQISPRISTYIGTDYSNNNYFGALFESLIIISQLLFGFIVKKIDDEKNNKKNKSSIISGGIVIATIISILAMKATIFNRFLHYFSIFTIVWTPNAIEQIYRSKNKFYTVLTIIFLFFIYFIIIGIYRPEWYGVVPYKFLD